MATLPAAAIRSLCAAGLLALSAGPASAARTHHYSEPPAVQKRLTITDFEIRAMMLLFVVLMAFQAYGYNRMLYIGLNPVLAQAHRVNAPAVFAGAWYDIFSQSTLESFIRVHNSGGPGARGKCRLVMSPGGHATLARDLFPKV